MKRQSIGKVAWYYEPWIVILLIFLVLGPLGLPLVYKSPKFNRIAKAILTVVTISYTVYLVWAALQSVREILAGSSETSTFLKMLLG